MLRDKIPRQYLEMDRNCAESILGAANEQYELGLADEALKLVSGFGGGLGCEQTCGALCGAIAVLGAIKVDGHAHATEGFGKLCGDFVRLFEDKLGSGNCRELKERYRNDEVRCMRTVELAADVLEAYLQEIGT